MKEQLINLEIANLAKEKGFTPHTISTKFTNDYLLGGKNVMINDVCVYVWMCEVQKWFREVHNIYIEVSYYHGYNEDRFYYEVKIKEDEMYLSNQDSDDNIYTYEQALELGLLEAFNLI